MVNSCRGIVGDRRGAGGNYFIVHLLTRCATRRAGVTLAVAVAAVQHGVYLGIGKPVLPLKLSASWRRTGTHGLINLSQVKTSSIIISIGFFI